MKIEKIMKWYYEDRLREIPDAPCPETRQARTKSRKHGSFPVSWEDILGFIVTAVYFMQFLLPDRWFALGRIASVFRIGF
jgi:hypothetical protein